MTPVGRQLLIERVHSLFYTLCEYRLYRFRCGDN